MKKIYYLSTCDTCKRILKTWEPLNGVSLQDIKTEPLSEDNLDQLKELAGSFEALFSKRARLYKERQLKDQNLGEREFKKLLLEHYTFLKRPVLVLEDAIFIGNSNRVVLAAKEALHP
jgi:arsenate reductase